MAAARPSNRFSHRGPTPCSPAQSTAVETSVEELQLVFVVLEFVTLLMPVLVLWVCLLETLVELAVARPAASFVVVSYFHMLHAASATD